MKSQGVDSVVFHWQMPPLLLLWIPINRYASLCMRHLVIVDGHHLMYRAYWAIPRTMRNSSGLQVNTPFGFASMFLQILKIEQPDYFLFCFDKGDTTFRHTEYAAYKAGRAETPDDFYPQVPLVHTFIETLGCKSVSDERYEADDLACSYAKWATEQGLRVTIVSGDRDLFQLCTETVRVSIPHKGYQLPEYCTPAHIMEKYGVTPAQIPSYKGLVGDASDNLKGVAGIGPKAASSLLQTYGSLSSLYNHLQDIKPSWRQKLEAGRESAFFCERMATLVCDIPCEHSLSALALESLPIAEITALFSSLEFHMLNRRFATFLHSSGGEKYRSLAFQAEALFAQSSGDAPQQELFSQLSLL